METRNNSINDSRHRGRNEPPSPALSPTQGGSNQRWMMHYKLHKNATSQDEPPPAAATLQEEPKTDPTQGTVQSMSDMLKRGQAALTSPNAPSTPSGDFSGLISKAKDGLTQNNHVTTRQDPGMAAKPPPKKPEVQLSESDLQWEALEKHMKRPLLVKDLDFTDLGEYYYYTQLGLNIIIVELLISLH